MAEVQAPTNLHEGGRAGSALAQMQSLLVSGETLESWAVQRRGFALTHRRVIVGATSGRLVVMHRGLFGGFRLRDVRWQDLKDVTLRVGIFAADLVVTALASTDLAVAGQETPTIRLNGLRKEQGQSVYRICQTHEQAWREKRRIRELEEMRAKSGGITLGSGLSAPSASAGNEDLIARLQSAKEMLDKGLITDAEYEAIKAKVVSGL